MNHVRKFSNGVKILGIGGSPRMGGNTDLLLDKALEGAESQGAAVEKIVLSDLVYSPCQSGYECHKTGRCVIDDDMKIIYKRMAASDGIIMASPIYFGSVSAQLKMMIDRFQCCWALKYILKKPPLPKKRRYGIFLCVAGLDKKEFFENAKSIIKIFFLTLNIKYLADLFCGDIDEKGRIKEKRGALKKAFELGAALVNSLEP